MRAGTLFRIFVILEFPCGGKTPQVSFTHTPDMRQEHMDIAITRWINSFSGTAPALDQTMIAITHYGIFVLIAAVAAQWWGRQDRETLRHGALVSGLSFLCALAVNQVILLFIHRIRPYDAGITRLIIEKNPDWSFPSDHATGAVAIIAGLAFAGLPRRATRLCVLAAAICVSRVYVGTHYTTDVLGGAVIATIVAFLVSKAWRRGSRAETALVRIL